MSVVTDPTDLDRFKIIFNYIDEELSARGLGAARQAVQTNGQTDGTTTFTRAAGDFGADGVVAGDVLCLIDDPAADGGIMGHYRVVSQDTATTITLDRAPANHTGSDLTWRVFAPGTVGNASPDVADGVTEQALYSFAKISYKTLAAGLGNANDLNQHTFPFTAITPKKMIWGGVKDDQTSAWKVAADNGTIAGGGLEGQTFELIRSGGWQEQDAAGVILREFVNVRTLAAAFASTAQVTYQLGDTTGDPADFRLTGKVNQAILMFGGDVGPDGGTGFAITGTNTIARNDGGDFAADGYRVGDYVTIRSAEDPANNGSHGPITAITSGANGDITIAGAGLTNNAADTTLILQVDHRRYLKLRSRPKAKTYVEADLTTIEVTLLDFTENPFPLDHADDPAITLQDGVMAGDGTATGEIFQETESHTTGSDGVTETAPTADPDAFTFTSAGSTFNSTARGVVLLRAGDAFVISTGNDAGSYVIKSVDSATVVTLWKDPALTYSGGQSLQSFDARTATRDAGASNGSAADVDGANGDLTSVGSTFDVDTAIGDRAVQAGDMVEITAGNAAVIGVYKVNSVQSATVLRLDTSDQPFGGQTGLTYRVLRPGMHLQRFETTGSSDAADHAFNDVNPDTITRGSGSFLTNGFVNGCEVIVTNADLTANNGNRVLATAAALTLTFIAEETLTTDASDTNAVVAFDYGVIRSINSIEYPFHWRLFANTGNLSQIFQFVQWQLRLASDIDEGSGTSRGDITDLLMTFAAPNGVTLDMFPDDLSTGELNNVTYTDQTGDSRNNAFLVGITLVPNQNIIDAPSSRITLYFTDPDGTPSSGDEFNTNGAIIIDNDVGADMDFLNVSGNQQTTFDYTNNAQGGRTPDTDAAYTLVATGDDNAQHIVQTGTITKVNSITIPVSPAVERNFEDL